MNRLSEGSLILVLTTAQAKLAVIRAGGFAKLSSSTRAHSNHASTLAYSEKLQESGTLLEGSDLSVPNGSLIAGILGFWSQVQDLQSTISHNWFMERRLAAGLMLSTWRVWYWVETTFCSYCQSSLTSGDRTSWVGLLAHACHEHILRRGTSTFERQDFLPLPAMSIQRIQRTMLSGNTALDAAVHAAVSIMHEWMNFPSETSNSAVGTATVKATLDRSRFVHILLSVSLDTSTLLLPSIWESWQQIGVLVFGKRASASISGDSWDDLDAALEESGIGNSKSTLNALVLAHAGVCAKASKKLGLPLLSEHDLDILGSYSEFLHSSSSSSPSYSWDLYHSEAGGATRNLTPPPYLVPAGGTGLNNTNDCEQIKIAAQTFAKFLRDFVPLCPNAGPPAVDSLSEQQISWLYAINHHARGSRCGQDFYNPLRELAYSRQLVTSDLGPFSPNFIRTAGGLFSSLVYRGITFGCNRFLELDHLNRFPSLTAWEVAYAAAKTQNIADLEICNPAAYGHPTGRNVKHAAAYWRAGNELWVNFLQSHDAAVAGRVSWSSGLTFLQSQKSRRQQYFPEFGKLTCFLLAADLYYAGVFQCPTLNEMASSIWVLNAGARSGLVKLGVAQTAGTRDEFLAVFEEFYGAVDTVLTSQEKLETGWGVFVLEHGLCKGKRLKVFE
jgi:hypothetical protein